MPTAAMAAITTAGIHQPHGPMTAKGRNAPARAVNNATQTNRINAAHLSRHSLHHEVCDTANVKPTARRRGDPQLSFNSAPAHRHGFRAAQTDQRLCSSFIGYNGTVWGRKLVHNNG